MTAEKRSNSIPSYISMWKKYWKLRAILNSCCCTSEKSEKHASKEYSGINHNEFHVK